MGRDMEQDLHRRALKKRAELIEQIKKIDIFLEEYQELAGFESSNSLEERLAEMPELRKNRKPEQVENENSEKKLRVRAQNPKPAEVITLVKRILRAEQRPMTRTELLSALLERGMVVAGVDPAKVLGTNLWRSEEIEKAKFGGYWIKGEPLLPSAT